MRVFIGTAEVAGIYGRVAEALIHRGHLVTVVGPGAHSFQYNHRVQKHRLVAWFERSAASLAQRGGGLCFRVRWQLGRLILFFWAAFSHTHFLYTFGTSLLPVHLDLWILRCLNKTVISNVGHGSELRPSYINGAFALHPNVRRDLKSIEQRARRQKSIARRVEAWSSYVIGMPMSCHFLEKPFINWFAIGIPFSSSASFRPPTKRHQTGKVRLLHAPSSRIAKGTELIRSAVNRVIAQGYDVEYVEVSDVPHSVVLENLSICDLVLDQLYSDTPMAGLATEAAAFGKPSIVGMYAKELIDLFIPEGMSPPSFRCHPDDFYDVLVYAVEHDSERDGVGTLAQQFVDTHWSSDSVAMRYEQIFRGNVSMSWFVDPLAVQYLHGVGIPEKVAKDLIASLVNKYGVSVLQLRHNPSLRRAILEFAGC